MSAGAARLRVDVFGGEPARARARRPALPQLPAGRRPHLARGHAGRARHRLAPGRRQAGLVRRPGHDVHRRPGRPGPIQKVVVAMLALRMEAVGLHPFHASAVRLPGPDVVFLGGESNHGKSMGQIEAVRSRRRCSRWRPRRRSSTRTGRAAMGSVAPFLVKRTEGTERADKAAPDRGVEKFLGDDADLGHVPGHARDRRRGRAGDRRQLRPERLTELIPFERQFQSLHSLQNYFLLNELLAPGCTDADRRHRRAPRAARPRSSRGSASGPSSSSVPPPPRCCWTRWSGSCEARRCTRSPTPGPRPLAEAVALLAAHGPDARLLAGGTDLVIRLRDGSAHPSVVDRRQADRRARPGDPRGRTAASSSARRRS